MRFTNEKKDAINKAYKESKTYRMRPVEVFNDAISVGSMCICDITDLQNTIESLEMMKGIIEDVTGVVID